MIMRLRQRLLPALLVAAGVALLGNGLLAYTSAVETPTPDPPLATFVPLPSIDSSIVLPSGSFTPDPTFPPDRVSTRIVVRRLGIDLPVMLQTARYGEFPLCDVAMYLPTLGQPGSGRATYIYAHARTGMFRPLLLASRRADGGRSMIGMAVEVYTSDSWRFVYEITEVRRHQLDLHDALETRTERLWLQTSEGPVGTTTKLQVVADFRWAAPADPKAAHPTPHPRICS